MRERTLKGLLMPPFRTHDNSIYVHDRTNTCVFALNSAFLSEYAKDLTTRMEILEFLAAALNEKAERDLAEPLRWIEIKHGAWDGGSAYKCPKCDIRTDEDVVAAEYSFCPHCGRNLLPPRKKGNK